MAPLTLAQLEKRIETLGGSDAAVAVGISPYKTPLELYFEKTGLSGAPDISGNDAVYWGSRLEDVIAEEYERRTGNVVKYPKNTFYHKEHTFMSAHVDGNVTEMLVDNSPVILNRGLECKTANLYLEREWGDTDSDQIPLHYIVQTQHYNAVMGWDSCDVAVLIGGQDFRIYNIPRDDDLIADLMRAEAVFWARVQNHNPPAPSNNDDLKLLYGIDSGKAIEATQDIRDAVAALKALKKDIKTKEKQQVDLEFTVKSYMKDAATLTVADLVKPILTWKTQDNNRFQTTDFQSEHPKLCAAFTLNKPSRVMRVK